MFVGTVSCEIEVGKAQTAFRGFRMLLVEPEHKVDWEGPVVAIDTVQARVGDLVVVALAPFGAALEIPADLPVEAAVVAIVRALSGAVTGGGAAPARVESPAPMSRPPARPAPPAEAAEATDVVPRHIRSLMEGAAPGGHEDSMDRGDVGRRRRRRGRGGRGGRGRPDHLPETEGEFLEDESRFGPEPEVAEMGPREEEERRPELVRPEREERPGERLHPGDRERGERGDRGDRGDRGHPSDRGDRGEHRGDRGPRGGGGDRDRDRRDRHDRPPRHEDRPRTPAEREDRPRTPAEREDRPRTPAEREDRFPRRPSERPEPAPSFGDSRPSPDAPERTREQGAEAGESEFRPRAHEPRGDRAFEPRREPERPVERTPERPAAEPPPRMREQPAGEGGGSGVVWGQSPKTEGFSIGEGASAGMSTGVRRPRKRRR